MTQFLSESYAFSDFNDAISWFARRCSDVPARLQIVKRLRAKYMAHTIHSLVFKA